MDNQNEKKNTKLQPKKKGKLHITLHSVPKKWTRHYLKDIETNK